MKFWALQNFRSKNFLCKKFGSKTNFGSETNFWVQKNLGKKNWVKKNYGSEEKILGLKQMGLEIILGQKKNCYDRSG